jgi:hypothetical protein
MNIQELKDKKLIIFESYRGSFVYGTYIEGISDKDMCGVYIQPLEDIMGYNKYIPQVQDEKGDCVYYEVGRFLELLTLNNPNILEILNIPDEFIVYKHPVFDLILREKEKFITKKCSATFGGYAYAQCKKASGQDKMMNWEKSKTIRKGLIDFCYVINGSESKPLKSFLKENGMEQIFCGVVNVPNAKDVFSLFYDWKAHNCFAKSMDKDDKEHNKKVFKGKGETVGLGYKGLSKEGVSNSIRLSSVPRTESSLCNFIYQKDSYSSHCKDYKKYKNWIKNRNIQRWIDVKNHGQLDKEKNSKIDAKNLLHCVRIIDMSIEILEGKGVIVRRPNAQELLNIRNGEVDLFSILKSVDEKIKKTNELCKTSKLPDMVDECFVNELLINVRRNFYNI